MDSLSSVLLYYIQVNYCLIVVSEWRLNKKIKFSDIEIDDKQIHDDMEIADPGSMQDACMSHINSV